MDDNAACDRYSSTSVLQSHEAILAIQSCGYSSTLDDDSRLGRACVCHRLDAVLDLASVDVSLDTFGAPSEQVSSSHRVEVFRSGPSWKLFASSAPLSEVRPLRRPKASRTGAEFEVEKLVVGCTGLWYVQNE